MNGHQTNRSNGSNIPASFHQHHPPAAADQNVAKRAAVGGAAGAHGCYPTYRGLSSFKDTSAVDKGQTSVLNELHNNQTVAYEIRKSTDQLAMTTDRRCHDDRYYDNQTITAPLKTASPATATRLPSTRGMVGKDPYSPLREAWIAGVSWKGMEKMDPSSITIRSRDPSNSSLYWKVLSCVSITHEIRHCWRSETNQIVCFSIRHAMLIEVFVFRPWYSCLVDVRNCIYINLYILFVE